MITSSEIWLCEFKLNPWVFRALFLKNSIIFQLSFYYYIQLSIITINYQVKTKKNKISLNKYADNLKNS